MRFSFRGCPVFLRGEVSLLGVSGFEDGELILRMGAIVVDGGRGGKSFEIGFAVEITSFTGVSFLV